MSTTEIPRNILEIEKLRTELETELARRHNWGQQERFWERQQANLENQERYWRWQQWILLGTMVVAVGSLVVAGLGLVFGRFW